MNKAQAYYHASLNAPIRPALNKVVNANQAVEKVAIDCGCGVGNESAFLLEQGYHVHGFDTSAIAADICKARFAGQSHYQFTQCGFEAFNYPQSSLIMANASLYFCEKAKFAQVWQAWQQSLQSGGVLLVDFLGIEDEWLQTSPDMLAFTEDELRKLLQTFEILTLKEIKGIYPLRAGGEKFWHSFIVVARK